MFRGFVSCPTSLAVGTGKQFKVQMANGKWQMENHLKFDVCHLTCCSALRVYLAAGGLSCPLTICSARSFSTFARLRSVSI